MNPIYNLSTLKLKDTVIAVEELYVLSFKGSLELPKGEKGTSIIFFSCFIYGGDWSMGKNNLPTLTLNRQMTHNPCFLSFIHFSLLMRLVHITRASGKWSYVETKCWISHSSAWPLLGTLGESSINLPVLHLPVTNFRAACFCWRPSFSRGWLVCLTHQFPELSLHSHAL